MNEHPEVMPDGPAPTEPSSDIRTLASAIRQLYVALVAEGFTEAQAAVIVANMFWVDGKTA